MFGIHKCVKLVHKFMHCCCYSRICSAVYD